MIISFKNNIQSAKDAPLTFGEYSSWLLESGTKPVWFGTNEPKPPNMSPGAAPARGPAGGAGLEKGPAANELNMGWEEGCWDIEEYRLGLIVQCRLIDADGFICCEEVADKNSLVNSLSLSLSRPSPVGLSPRPIAVSSHGVKDSPDPAKDKSE